MDEFAQFNLKVLYQLQQQWQDVKAPDADDT